MSLSSLISLLIFISLHFDLSSSLSLFISLDLFSLLSFLPLCCCCVCVAVLLLSVGWLVAVVVCFVSLCVVVLVVVVVVVVWRVWCGTLKTTVCPSKTPPCVDSKRLRVYPHQSHMLKHMRVVPVHTGTF